MVHLYQRLQKSSILFSQKSSHLLEKGARSGRLINIWAAQGKSQQTYQQLLRRGVPKAELDWWLQQGPLSWDYPFPELNNLKVGIDWHNTLQKGEGNSIPTYNEYALELLLEKGFKVTILSYCGEERRTQFFASCLEIEVQQQVGKN